MWIDRGTLSRKLVPCFSLLWKKEEAEAAWHYNSVTFITEIKVCVVVTFGLEELFWLLGVQIANGNDFFQR